MKNATDSQLLEAKNLFAKIEKMVNIDYSHIALLLPQGFYNSVTRFNDVIEKEIEKRGL